MKHTQHTAGPWHYGDAHIDHHSEFTCFCIGNGAASVAKVMVYPAIGREEAEANAHLIAAAPMLLQAAKKTMAYLNDLAKSNPGYLGKLVLQDYKQWNEAMIELPAAIAKAEGKL